MITLRYSCPECGLVDIAVQVPAREDPEPEAVLTWMQQVVLPTVADDHNKRSPNCHPKELKDLKIPFDKNSEFIGQQIE
jgi:hypothetical protein